MSTGLRRPGAGYALEQPDVRPRVATARVVVIAALLFGSWILLSGKLDAVHLGAGAATAIAVAMLARPSRRARLLYPVRAAAYAVWLLAEIAVSNLRVARLVLSPQAALRPRLVRTAPRARGDGALALLGCSITLTPGTVTLDVTDDELVVHALDEASAQAIERGDMAARVVRLFGEVP